MMTLLMVAMLGPSAVSPAMAPVGPGSYLPIDRDAAPALAVPRFLLDTVPVTNRDYLAFVTAHPQWRRDRVKRVFAEAAYLSNWAGPLDPGNAAAEAPVVSVSWFAAEAFCAARGKRLPSEAEWELAAAASATAKDARRDPRFVNELLAWYGAHPEHMSSVGATPANAWGIHDLHGLVWEWVADFTSSLAPSDARGGEDAAFCGTAAGGTADAAAYAAFMRRAFRSSLEGAYALPTLGFRCAQDLPISKRPR